MGPMGPIGPMVGNRHLKFIRRLLPGPHQGKRPSAAPGGSCSGHSPVLAFSEG